MLIFDNVEDLMFDYSAKFQLIYYVMDWFALLQYR